MKPIYGQDRTPVVYAGRFSDKVLENLPGSKVLDEWDVLPHQLAETTREATELVILDPLSFPFEAMTDEQWDIPLFVMPPSEFDAETLMTVFGPVLLERVGPFDRVATADRKLWDTLRRRYSWANGQHVRLGSADPKEAAAELIPLIKNKPENPPSEKASHRIECRALASRISALRQAGAGSPLDVLEIGAGKGRWPASFDLAETRFYGVYTDEDAIEDARRDFPEYDFSLPEKDHTIARFSDTFDFSFSVNFMQFQTDLARSALVSEMWRVTRTGGTMVFLEDFVGGGSEDQKMPPFSLPEFVNLVTEVTVGRGTLDHVESLSYPGEDMVRSGLLSLQKLGGPGDE